MASSKKLNYKVELKLVNEKKRRKSDLVIMWQSIWGLVLQVTFHTRHTLQEMWESLKLWLWHDEFIEVRTFLRKYLPQVPDDLTHSWRDGKLLCILLNKLHPGCILDAEVLNPNYALRNMCLAFDILENIFGIKPSASAEEFVICIEGSNLKLLEILSQLQKKFESSRNIPKIIEPSEKQEEEQNNSASKNCIAKGTGLMLAFVGRSANFVIFCSSVTNLNLVLEIKGPLNTICRERITKRSPKKKQSTTQLPRNNPHCLSRSSSYTENVNFKEDKDEISEFEKNLIPLEYDIYMNQISVTYTPLIEGQHAISILWHGEHVSDSPYVVQVEPTIEINSIDKPKEMKSNLKVLSEEKNSECKIPARKPQATLEKIERIGKVIKRRVLRHIVKIKGKDIVVDSSDINHLAVALLKMDYNFQTDPSKTRRNSWGFAGDAERKLSVIRQFCVPPDEMEAQQMKLQRRSRSLTINTNAIQPLRRNTSFETEDIQQLPRLETVAEATANFDTNKLHSYNEEDEEAFADIDEEFQVEKQTLNETESEIVDDGIVNYNSKEVETKHFEDIHQVSTKSTEINDETLQSLFNVESKDFVSNDLNAENHSNLSPDSLMMSQEFLVRQTKQTKLTSNRSNEFIKEKYDNFSKALNLNLESHQPFNVGNATSELTNTFYKIGNDVLTEESNVLNNAVVSNTVPNITGNFENSTIHSSCSIEKYPNLMKYLDELCKNSSYGVIENCKKDSRTKSRFHYQREKNTNKIRYPTMNRSSCKNNCWHSHQEKERERRYKFYRKNRKYRSKTCDVEANEICYKVSQNNNIKIQYPKQASNNHSERKNEKQCVKHKACNKLEELNSKPIYDIERNTSKAKMNKLNFTELRDKPYFSQDMIFTNGREENLLNAKATNINCLKNVEKDDSLSLTEELKKAEFSSKEFSPNCFSDETVISACNSGKESMSQDLFQLTSSQLDTKVNSFYIQEHNLVSLGQFNFKQFNLSNERNKGNLIKNKIKKLENAIMRDSQKTNSKSKTERSSSIELVDVKAKLTFWENACHSNRRTQNDSPEVKTYSNQSSQEDELKYQNLNHEEKDTTGVLDVETKIRSDEFSLSNVDAVDLPLLDSEVVDRHTNKLEHNNDMDYERPIMKKSKLNQDPKSKRSFSDPVMMDIANRENLYASQNKLIESIVPYNVSSTDNLSSSLDADYWETSIDDDDSSADAIASTEDEYIDDEIPDSTYWGDISLMKNSKLSNISSYEEYCQYIDSEILKNQYHCAENCPSECKVFGIGNYFGYVAVKNRFHVLTKGAGNGNLSVSVQGFGQHDVSFVSVRYKQKDIYEVIYQVMRPGLYLISLRWMENPIVGSPFLCKITF